MKSNASFKVEGTQIEIKGSGPVSIKGNPIQLN